MNKKMFTNLYFLSAVICLITAVIYLIQGNINLVFVLCAGIAIINAITYFNKAKKEYKS